MGLRGLVCTSYGEELQPKTPPVSSNPSLVWIGQNPRKIQETGSYGLGAEHPRPRSRGCAGNSPGLGDEAA